MDASRNTRLNQTVMAIQRRWGPDALRKLRDLPAIAATSPIPTGFPELDDRLGIGGIPRGHITTLMGLPTAGLTTVTLKIIAQAQAAGEMAAYVDLNHSLDLDYVARCGVDLERLLLIRPPAAQQTPAIVRDLVFSRALGVVVCNGGQLLADDPAAANELLQVLRPLTAGLAGSSCALLMVMVPQNGQVLHEPATVLLEGRDALRLTVQQQGWLHEDQDVRGYCSRVVVVKNRFAPAGQSALITIDFTEVVHGDST